MHRLTAVLAAALLLAGAAAVGADEQPSPADTSDARMEGWMAHPQRTARALRTETPPRLDGVLDEEIWLRAPVHEGFTQSDPDQGEPASLRTTFQVAYDDDALYIGGVCYDDPDSVTARLARRDEWRERDFFEVSLDPHHDHQTGVWFTVGPSGWLSDGILFNDEDYDDGWDSVAEVATSRRADGWSLELKIPYHVLRFGEKETYTWGINVFRKVSRRAEWTAWSFTPRGVTGYASRFGHLEGIEGIRPQRSLEVLPFALGRGTLSQGADGDDDLFSSAGVDLRYGLSSNISLNATVNPDFGQVEGDPAVLNLGVFETFLRERRPFFLEGIQIFETPGPFIVSINKPSTLFHSRRIGRAPSRFDLPDDSDEVERPENTTILGAAKISGKTAGRTAFGLLNAVTGRERALVEQRLTVAETGLVDTVRRRVEVEPLTNYFIGRVQQDLLTSSTAGAQLTAVNGAGFEPAYVGAGDVHLRWGDNAYRLYSRFAASLAGQEEERDSGWEGALYFQKSGGAFGGQAYMDANSPGFEANDLGYMRRNDRIQAGVHVYHDRLDPWWLARRSGFNLNAWTHWNFDGERIWRGVNFNTWNNLHNYWGFWMGVSRNLAAVDDLVTRGGPPMVSPASTWVGMNVWADDRKPVSGRLWWNVRWSRGGDNLGTWVGFNLELRPMSRLSLEVGPGYGYNRNFAQWVENADDDGDGEDDRFLFGELDSRVLEVGLRGDWAFTPALSLQLYLQPFVTTGDYGAIKELARPRSYEFRPWDGLEENPDFHRRSLRSNLVLRWEYRPGSTLFAVWQQSRDRDFDGVRDPRFRPTGDLTRAFADDGDSIFLIKLNRWLGL